MNEPETPKATSIEDLREELQNKIDTEVARRIIDAEASEAESSMSVIVTCTSSSGLADASSPLRTRLSEAGLKVQNVVESISVASGTVGAGGARSIAALDDVEFVEYDGEMHALAGEDP